jgi:(3,5-dihydroxyphenyl)acetyl-CoA 1,2-dioxygenase
MAVVSTDILTGIGLPEEDVAAWSRAERVEFGSFPASARALSEYLTRGEALVARLPEKPARSEAESAAVALIADALNDARVVFLRGHAEELYSALTGDLKRFVRADELVYDAAERFPGLVPTRAAVDAELERKLADKEGVEIAQGLMLSHVLASQRCGLHLVHAMLRPTAAALERIDDFRRTGVADLGLAHVERRGRAGLLELRNPRRLNAEDDDTLGPTEAAVDLILLDPEIEVGAMRGGAVEHPNYEGRRIFGAGLNLTHLYYGRLSFLFFITRDLGYVNKLYRGLTGPEHRPGEPEDTIEKLWIAAVETYAIGGACQLLHVVDHVIAERGARLFLPARKEGIIPGASNLRLARFVGERLARQAIFSGREFEAGTPEGDMLCDEVVEPAEMDAAVEARIEALTSSGLVSAAANRRTMRVGQEPIDIFRQYMATFSKEQAYCHTSPALVRNLEEHWNARERTL